VDDLGGPERPRIVGRETLDQAPTDVRTVQQEPDQEDKLPLAVRVKSGTGHMGDGTTLRIT